MYVNKLIPVLALFLSSCAVTPVVSKDASNEAPATLKLLELDVFPGKVKRLDLQLPADIKTAQLECDGKLLPSHQDANILTSFFALDYKHLESTKKNQINCFLKYSKSSKIINVHVYTLNPKPFNYPLSYIKVDKKHVDLSAKDLKRFLKEKEQLRIVYETANKSNRLFESKFKRPLPSEITGVYGSRRVFNNKKDSWHSGTDFRARTPTPIPSVNKGVVAFAGDLFFNGKTVMIDHGQGVMTMYCHLSKINVKKGDTVSYETILGISGNTGRSSGPHLHWGVRVNDMWVDGLQFLDEQGVN